MNVIFFKSNLIVLVLFYLPAIIHHCVSAILFHLKHQ